MWLAWQRTDATGSNIKISWRIYDKDFGIWGNWLGPSDPSNKMPTTQCKNERPSLACDDWGPVVYWETDRDGTDRADWPNVRDWNVYASWQIMAGPQWPVAFNQNMIDLACDAVVTRMPGSTAREVRAQVRKVLNYESFPTRSDWFRKATLSATSA